MTRGMVVDVLPDGMTLGKEGDKDPRFRVVEFPKVPPEDLAHLVAGDKPPPLAPGKPPEKVALRKRVVALDVHALDAMLVDPMKKNEIEKNPVAAKNHLKSVEVAVALSKASAKKI